jgi:hypothetical protein
VVPSLIYLTVKPKTLAAIFVDFLFFTHKIYL